MIVLRVIYLLSVLVGLWINLEEYRHAKWVYSELWKRKINGVRQMLAATFVSEERMRVWIQCLLLIPAVVGFVLPRNLLVEVSDNYRVLLFLSLCAHIAVAVILTRKSLKHRHARREILSLPSHEHEGEVS